MFEISKERVPVPPRQGGKGRPAIYPFGDMEVGQHFDVPRTGGRTKGGNDRAQARVSCCAQMWSRRHGQRAKFTVRVVDDKTVRCWRVA